MSSAQEKTEIGSDENAENNEVNTADSEHFQMPQEFGNICISLVGNEVSIKTNDGTYFNGILASTNGLFGSNLQIGLLSAYKVKRLCDDELPSTETFVEKLTLDWKDICCLVDNSPATTDQLEYKNELRNDGQYIEDPVEGFDKKAQSRENAMHNFRDLVEWCPEHEDGIEQNSLEDTHLKEFSVDDMYKINKKMGIQSTYDDELHTYTNVNIGNVDSQARARAHALAAEIERSEISKHRTQKLENDDEEQDILPDSQTIHQRRKNEKRQNERNYQQKQHIDSFFNRRLESFHQSKSVEKPIQTVVPQAEKRTYLKAEPHPHPNRLIPTSQKSVQEPLEIERLREASHESSVRNLSKLEPDFHRPGSKPTQSFGGASIKNTQNVKTETIRLTDNRAKTIGELNRFKDEFKLQTNKSTTAMNENSKTELKQPPQKQSCLTSASSASNVWTERSKKFEQKQSEQMNSQPYISGSTTDAQESVTGEVQKESSNEQTTQITPTKECDNDAGTPQSSREETPSRKPFKFNPNAAVFTPRIGNGANTSGQWSGAGSIESHSGVPGPMSHMSSTSSDIPIGASISNHDFMNQIQHAPQPYVSVPHYLVPVTNGNQITYISAPQPTPTSQFVGQPTFNQMVQVPPQQLSYITGVPPPNVVSSGTSQPQLIYSQQPPNLTPNQQMIYVAQQNPPPQLQQQGGGNNFPAPPNMQFLPQTGQTTVVGPTNYLIQRQPIASVMTQHPAHLVQQMPPQTPQSSAGDALNYSMDYTANITQTPPQTPGRANTSATFSLGPKQGNNSSNELHQQTDNGGSCNKTAASFGNSNNSRSNTPRNNSTSSQINTTTMPPNIVMVHNQQQPYAFQFGNATQQVLSCGNVRPVTIGNPQQQSMHVVQSQYMRMQTQGISPRPFANIPAVAGQMPPMRAQAPQSLQQPPPSHQHVMFAGQPLVSNISQIQQTQMQHQQSNSHLQNSNTDLTKTQLQQYPLRQLNIDDQQRQQKNLSTNIYSIPTSGAQVSTAVHRMMLSNDDATLQQQVMRNNGKPLLPAPDFFAPNDPARSLCSQMPCLLLTNDRTHVCKQSGKNLCDSSIVICPNNSTTRMLDISNQLWVKPGAGKRSNGYNASRAATSTSTSIKQSTSLSHQNSFHSQSHKLSNSPLQQPPGKFEISHFSVEEAQISKQSPHFNAPSFIQPHLIGSASSNSSNTGMKCSGTLSHFVYSNPAHKLLPRQPVNPTQCQNTFIPHVINSHTSNVLATPPRHTAPLCPMPMRNTMSSGLQLHGKRIPNDCSASRGAFPWKMPKQSILDMRFNQQFNIPIRPGYTPTKFIRENLAHEFPSRVNP